MTMIARKKMLLLLMTGMLVATPFLSSMRGSLRHSQEGNDWLNATRDQGEVQTQEANPNVDYDYNSTAGVATIQTDNITVKVAGGGRVPQFTFWPTGDNTTVYHAKFLQLAEYKDGNGDGAFQYDEIVGRHKPKIFNFPQAEPRWQFSNFYNITNTTTNEEIGFGFNFTMKDFSAPGPWDQFQNLAINITNRFYIRNVQETLKAGNESVTFEIPGLSAVKTYVKVKNWNFESNKTKLALRWDISQEVFQGGKKKQSQLNGKNISFDKMSKANKTVPPAGKKQIAVKFKASGRINATVRAPPVVKVKKNTGVTLKNSSISYRTDGTRLRMFMSAPATDGPILFDPTTEISIGNDVTDPTLAIESPSPDAVLRKEEVTVSWAGYDNETFIAHYAVKLDNESWRVIGKKTRYTFKKLAKGPHTVTIKAVDKEGHASTATIQFEIKAVVRLFPVAIYGTIFAVFIVMVVTGTVFYYLKKKDAF